MINGPVAASFDVYDDFLSYKSGSLFLVDQVKVNKYNVTYFRYISTTQ